MKELATLPNNPLNGTAYRRPLVADVSKKNRSVMKRLSLIIISILALSSLDAEQVNSADAPVGKVHIYKQEGDTAREIEIFFRRIMTRQRKLFRASLCFMEAAGAEDIGNSSVISAITFPQGDSSPPL
ncbi:hypothetical protein OAF52_02110 [bacterium]|nr:hypothetical protein [bacterium]